jgi:hypothetical protein
VDDRLEVLAYGYSASSALTNIRFEVMLHHDFQERAQERLHQIDYAMVFLAYFQSRAYEATEAMSWPELREMMGAASELLDQVYGTASRRNDPPGL